ncbi:MAG: hypothetical protein IT378_06160 [Sandaracinaceae bacterium]|nr:hypothetical protein [Sandaracinaceae bacterium]
MTLLLLSALAPPASAQRPAGRVPLLTESTLSSLVWRQRGAVGRCASEHEVEAYLLTLSVRVTGRGQLSTLYDAALDVSARSRPRDPDFEGCVTASTREALRAAPYDVGPRTVRARHTFQVGEGPEPALPADARPYSEHEAQSTLRSAQHALQQCLQMAGVPEQVTLRISVRPDGRMVLQSADVPPGASGRALSCLASHVGSLRVEGRPARSATLVHRLPVAQRAW